MKRYIILSLTIAILLFTAIHPVVAQDPQQMGDQKNTSGRENVSDQKNKSDGQNAGDQNKMSEGQNAGGQYNKSYPENMSDREKASKMMEEGKSMRMEHDMEGMGFLSSGDNSYGEYVTFTIDAPNGSILNYAINGTPLFNISCDFNFESVNSEGSQTKVEDATGDAIIQLHDNPTAIINIMTKFSGKTSPIRHVTFMLTTGATATKENNLIRINSGNVVGYIGGDNATSISVSGDEVRLELTANSHAFFRATPVNMPMADYVQKRISQEIEDNGLGLELALGRNKTFSAINYSEGINASVREMASDRIRLSINATETAGRIITVNLDDSSLVIGPGERLGIHYDNESLDCGDNPDMIFNGTDRPLCWISPVQDSKTQILIYVPHYTEHTVDILVEPGATPTVTAPEVRTVTLDDDGKTITLQVNETFLLNLGEEYDWNISIDDQTVISREVNVLVVRGAQGIYRAHKPGSATLTAVGDPVCRKAVPPCATPSRQFRLNIVVSGGPAGTPKTPGFEVLSAVGTLLALLLLVRRR